MAFRDDNEALRARVQVLEAEVDELREELAEKEAAADAPPPAVRVDVGDDAETDAASTHAGADAELERDIASMIAAREARERAARDRSLSAAERKRAARAARYAARPERVVVESREDRVVVRVAPRWMRDALVEGWGWRYGFLFVNPERSS